MSDLVAFVRARLDQEEAGARFMMDREARIEVPRTDWLGFPFGERVLREVEAMRAIVLRCSVSLEDPQNVRYGMASRILGDLAGIWRDHEDYDPGWAR